MTERREIATTIIGFLPSDPDNVPCAPPGGFIWFLPGNWGGTHEAYGITDVRVSCGGKTLDFVITLADALALREELDRAIAVMRELANDDPDSAP